MRRFVVLTILVLLLAAGCGQEQVLSPSLPLNPALAGDGPDAQALAVQIAGALGWEVNADLVRLDRSVSLGAGTLVDPQRQVIAGDVVHYSCRVRTGSGPWDYIGLHRVVREERLGRPIRTVKAVFLQHGDAKNFVGMYLPGLNSASTPDDFGIAVFLARHDVDVWGIDQAWTLVPNDMTDLSFTPDSGLDRQVKDLSCAIRIARHLRLVAGPGLDKIIVSGYSSGTTTCYALLNEETQLPPGRRQVRGYIPIDMAPAVNDDDWILSFTSYLPYYQSLAASGQYLFDTGFVPLGTLARTDPDGASPIIPGFTNLQAALYMAAGPIFGTSISTHYLAGIWDGDMPVGLQFVTLDQWLDFTSSAPQYEAVQFIIDYSRWIDPTTDEPWDDYFAEITVPILNLGAAGGADPFSDYCLSLLGSTDITKVRVQLRPDEEALLDFGHIDIFIASNAPELAWQPMLDWIESHSTPLTP
jgi:hypothetical protein